MTAFNVVRFRVKPGMEQEFVDSHRKLRPAFEGFVSGSLIKTGDRTFCLIGEWRSFPSIVAARPQMIAVLDNFRNMLEDLGGDLGLTDPVSGEAVAKLAVPKARKAIGKKKAARKPAKRPARKTAKKKAAPAKRKLRR